MTNKFFHITAIIAIVAIVLIVGLINGASNVTGKVVDRVPATVSKAATDVTVIIPPHAVEVAPNVFNLGTAIHNGESVQGYMIIDYRKGFGHKPRHNPGPKGGGGKETCFAFLAKGARWKVTEPYILNPTNSDGMSNAFVESSIGSSVESWDSEAAFDVFGPGSITFDTLVADTVSPDNKNEVYFGAIEGPGSIAVTIVWGVFGGPPQNRRLVEWDMVFDGAEFRFGNADLDSSVMDLLNIGAHEVGHAAGLGHPDDSCTEETMYRFAGFGETKKRTLNAGDIAGVKKLYK